MTKTSQTSQNVSKGKDLDALALAVASGEISIGVEELRELVRSLKLEVDHLKGMVQTAQTLPVNPNYEANQKKKTSLIHDIREWIAEHPGTTFTAQNLYKDLFTDYARLSKGLKHNIRQTLLRLAQQETIIKIEGRARYKIPDTQCVELEPFNCDSSELDVFYPFGEHHLTATYPGEVVCVFGARNSGKTSYAFNFLSKNQYIHRIWYFGSELGNVRLKHRLDRFPGVDWRIKQAKENGNGITFFEKVGNWEDVIRPNDINVIDFVQVYEDFYKVGAIINRIFRRLNNGMAMIFLQKKRGMSHITGVGGEFTLDVPSLAVALDKYHAQLVKVKNVRDKMQTDPEGMRLKFKTEPRGGYLKALGDWRQPT